MFVWCFFLSLTIKFHWNSTQPFVQEVAFCKIIEKSKKLHGIDQEIYKSVSYDDELAWNYPHAHPSVNRSYCWMLSWKPGHCSSSDLSQNTFSPQFICFNRKCSTYISTTFSVCHSLPWAGLGHLPCAVQAVLPSRSGNPRELSFCGSFAPQNFVPCTMYIFLCLVDLSILNSDCCVFD